MTYMRVHKNMAWRDRHDAILYYSVPHFLDNDKDTKRFDFFSLALIIVFVILCYYA